jgi:hypothetical protein
MSLCLKCLGTIEGGAHYGLHPSCFRAWFEVEGLPEFTSLVLKQSSKGEEPSNDSRNSSFFHGQYKKYSAELNGRSYILKVRQASAPELPELEFLCNQIAELVGLPVAKYYMLEMMGDRAFVTRNFIDRSEHASLSHIYTYFADGEARTCENIVRVIDEQTHRFTDVETFVMMCLFDGLIGNHDRHGRNLGIIVTSRGSKLAPIYDNPSVVGIHAGDWLKADIGFEGRIPTKDSEHPTISDYVVEFARLGYQDQIDRFRKLAKLERVEGLISKSFCSDLMKLAITRMIRKNHDELERAQS